MTEEERKQVYQALLARSKNGKLGKNDTKEVATQFGHDRRAVQRLWQRGKIALANNIPVDLGSRKRGRVGRKASTINLELLRNIPLKERMVIEDVCAKLSMSKATVIKYLKKKVCFGAILVASNPISLKLTRSLDYSGVLTWLRGIWLLIQGLRICMTLCSSMKSGSFSIKV